MEFLPKNKYAKSVFLDCKEEERDLSDLANSCEYLTSEKLCLAVSESEKAKAARQVRCKNDDKMTCCYLCMFVMDCATPCQFLGNTETEPQQIDPEKTPVNSTTISEQRQEEDKKVSTIGTYCSECSAEMSQTRTKLRIDGWEGSHQKSADEDSGRIAEEELPVIVYLCRKCGKIEFRAEEKRNKN
jgi:hypothetical protein